MIDQVALQNDYCFRSDDYVLSNYFARHNIQGIKTAEIGLMADVAQLEFGKDSKDALHNLEAGGHGSHDILYTKCENYLRTKGLAVLHVSSCDGVFYTIKCSTLISNLHCNFSLVYDK